MLQRRIHLLRISKKFTDCLRMNKSVEDMNMTHVIYIMPETSQARRHIMLFNDIFSTVSLFETKMCRHFYNNTKAVFMNEYPKYSNGT